MCTHPLSGKYIIFMYLISELFRSVRKSYTLVNLILKKIGKIVATSRHILRLKCTKIDFGWGSAPDRTGELIALPQAPSCI